MSTLRKLLRLAEPNQPVECWIVAVIFGENHQPVWCARTHVSTTDAQSLGLTNSELPRGCDLENPILVIATLGIPHAVAIHENMEYLKELVDIPLLSNDIFLERYQQELNRLIHLDNEQIRIMKEMQAILSTW
jgi:hypothetical protein